MPKTISKNNPFHSDFSKQVEVLERFRQFAIQQANGNKEDPKAKVIEAFMWLKVNLEEVKQCRQVYLQSGEQKNTTVEETVTFGNIIKHPLHLSGQNENCSQLVFFFIEFEQGIQEAEEANRQHNLLNTLENGLCLDSFTRSIRNYLIHAKGLLCPSVDDLLMPSAKQFEYAAATPKDYLTAFARCLGERVAVTAETKAGTYYKHLEEKDIEKYILDCGLLDTDKEKSHCTLQDLPNYAVFKQLFDFRVEFIERQHESLNADNIKKSIRKFINKESKATIKLECLDKEMVVCLRPAEADTVILALAHANLWQELLFFLECYPKLEKVLGRARDPNTGKTALHKVIEKLNACRTIILDEKELLAKRKEEESNYTILGEIIVKLINFGANILEKDESQLSCLSYAMWGKSPDVIYCMLNTMLDSCYPYPLTVDMPLSYRSFLERIRTDKAIAALTQAFNELLSCSHGDASDMVFVMIDDIIQKELVAYYPVIAVAMPRITNPLWYVTALNLFAKAKHFALAMQVLDSKVQFQEKKESLFFQLSDLTNPGLPGDQQKFVEKLVARFGKENLSKKNENNITPILNAILNKRKDLLDIFLKSVSNFTPAIIAFHLKELIALKDWDAAGWLVEQNYEILYEKKLGESEDSPFIQFYAQGRMYYAEKYLTNVNNPEATCAAFIYLARNKKWHELEWLVDLNLKMDDTVIISIIPDLLSYQAWDLIVKLAQTNSNLENAIKKELNLMRCDHVVKLLVNSVITKDSKELNNSMQLGNMTPSNFLAVQNELNKNSQLKTWGWLIQHCCIFEVKWNELLLPMKVAIQYYQLHGENSNIVNIQNFIKKAESNSLEKINYNDYKFIGQCLSSYTQNFFGEDARNTWGWIADSVFQNDDRWESKMSLSDSPKSPIIDKMLKDKDTLFQQFNMCQTTPDPKMQQTVAKACEAMYLTGDVCVAGLLLEIYHAGINQPPRQSTANLYIKRECVEISSDSGKAAILYLHLYQNNVVTPSQFILMHHFIVLALYEKLIKDIDTATPEYINNIENLIAAVNKIYNVILDKYVSHFNKLITNTFFEKYLQYLLKQMNLPPIGKTLSREDVEKLFFASVTKNYTGNAWNNRSEYKEFKEYMVRQYKNNNYFDEMVPQMGEMFALLNVFNMPESLPKLDPTLGEVVNSILKTQLGSQLIQNLPKVVDETKPKFGV